MWKGSFACSFEFADRGKSIISKLLEFTILELVLEYAKRTVRGPIDRETTSTTSTVDRARLELVEVFQMIPI